MGTYSDAEIAFIKSKIADLEAIIDELEDDNDDGRYTAEIKRLKNQVTGLRYSISGQN